MSVLITPEALEAQLQTSQPPLLLDCRAFRQDSAEAAVTLPGSRRFDLERDMSAASGAGGRHPLPSQAAFTATLLRLGVTPGRAVVVFDDQGGRLAAARGWWMLACWAGHPDVRVLDGGIQAWQAAGGETVPLAPNEVSRETAAGATAWQPDYHDTAWIGLERLAAEGGQLIDARAASRFRGEEEPLNPVAGHIPDALCHPCADNLAADGRFQSPAALAATLPQGERLTAYCGSGVTACHNILAYAVAGLALPRLYVGSWSEWIEDAGRPVATGPA
ncbi:sulfurtransferase [Salinicola endophyticus]|uniref:Sulfurtransferase n=1 Tax=Salinicola endophyticus TaxID=1949083 RepID=A0ABY8FJV1_9GAMM|nr:sulfurtransferase [Salinicola endophyticus]WFF43085.1 sulfurtransferase [Salinicola endophyticus]